MAKIYNPISRPQIINFSNTNNLTITHNLGYRPIVYCVVNNEMAYCDVTHNSKNELVVSFQNSISGTLFLR